MCGIAGWIGPGAGIDVLRAMTDAVTHRGPDGEGQAIMRIDGGTDVALGHRRLSIIDLAGGTQPMASHDGRFTIVFNGEIYNYIELRAELSAKGAVFRTRSDTEVIIEAWRFWGEEALTRFRGMFAFALWDEAGKKLVLARDPFGKKPLFISQRNAGGRDTLIFGSEIRAVLAHPHVVPELDIASLHDYLTWRYVPGPNTFFLGIRKLVPGGVIVWQDGKITERRYWLPPEENPNRAPAPSDPVDAFLEVFDEAVRLRLRADVPLGAFLSGGLDSSAIVATLAHLGASEIRTFSVGFKGDPASELPAAAETANFFGTIHTSLELDPSDLTTVLPQLSRHRGAPVADTADMPIYLLSVEAAKNVKVILSGEGSDEMFAGYPKHLVEAHLGRFAPSGLLSVAGRALLAATAIVPGRARRMTIAARAMRERDFAERMVRWFGAITPEERTCIWTGPAIGRVPNPIPFHAAPGATPLRRVLHFDQTSWLPDNLLERMDMMTMAASIEARAPFMDVKLAEFAASVPEEWRIRGRVTKRIVRDALGPRLPEAVIKRPKNGFKVPVAEWFRGALKEPFRDFLLSADAVTADYLDRTEVSRLASEHAESRRDHDKTLWALFSLEAFLREFF